MRNVDEAVCFAPVGIGTNVNDFLERYGSKTPASKIINYNNPKDFWTNRFRNRLYGTNYTIGAINQHGDNHTLENMKPLYTRKKANPSYSPNKKGCAGTYHVNSYKKADGTEVSDYYRTCGARHKSLDGVDIRFAAEKLSDNEIKAGKAKYAGKKFQDLTPEELQDAIRYFV